MSPARRKVYIYPSPGRDPAEALALVRARYPDDYVDIIMPPPDEREPRCLSAYYRLLGHLRSLKPDVFVTLFQSPRLELLAALTRAPEPAYCALDGEMYPLSRSATVVMLRHLWRATHGRITYAKVWLAVHLRRV